MSNVCSLTSVFTSTSSKNNILLSLLSQWPKTWDKMLVKNLLIEPYKSFKSAISHNLCNILPQYNFLAYADFELYETIKLTGSTAVPLLVLLLSLIFYCYILDILEILKPVIRKIKRSSYQYRAELETSIYYLKTNWLISNLYNPLFFLHHCGQDSSFSQFNNATYIAKFDPGLIGL